MFLLENYKKIKVTSSTWLYLTLSQEKNSKNNLGDKNRSGILTVSIYFKNTDFS